VGLGNSLFATFASGTVSPGRCTLRIAECGISKRCILRNFICGKSLRNKVYFAELISIGFGSGEETSVNRLTSLFRCS